MENFINQYFIEPIWAHTGYNIVNTLVYAAIALLALFLIFRLLKGRISINNDFICGTLCFVLLGSTMRVVTDSIDTGVFRPATAFHSLILDSGIYNYGYLTVSPGIYIVVAFLFFASVAILNHLKRMELLKFVGTVLWLPHILLLLPLMDFAAFILPVVAIAALPTALAFLYFRDRILTGVVAAHSLDGAATFFIIEFFPKFTGIHYFEQHVFSSAIADIFGSYFFFFLLKAAIAFGAAYLLREEKMELDERNYFALVLMIMGFAPGIRDVLRMALGA